MCGYFFTLPSIPWLLSSALCHRWLVTPNCISCFSCHLSFGALLDLTNGKLCQRSQWERVQSFLPYSLSALGFQFWKCLSPSIILASIWQPIFHGSIGNIIIAPHPFNSMDDSHFLLLIVSACLILPPWFFYAACIL